MIQLNIWILWKYFSVDIVWFFFRLSHLRNCCFLFPIIGWFIKSFWLLIHKYSISHIERIISCCRCMRSADTISGLHKNEEWLLSRLLYIEMVIWISGWHSCLILWNETDSRVIVQNIMRILLWRLRRIIVDDSILLVLSDEWLRRGFLFLLKIGLYTIMEQAHQIVKIENIWLHTCFSGMLYVRQRWEIYLVMIFWVLQLLVKNMIPFKGWLILRKSSVALL